MKQTKTVLRSATREDAALIARLSARSGAGGRSGIRDTTQPDQHELGQAIAAGTAGYYVVSTTSDEPIGVVEWRWTGQRVARSVSVGILIADDSMWTLGYGAEAIDNVIEELFYTHDVHRVEFMTALSNHAMASMLARRGGPVIDGILRDYFYVDGQYEDAVVWSILRHEFDEASEGLADRVERQAARRRLMARSARRIATYVVEHEETSVHGLVRERGPVSPGEVDDGDDDVHEHAEVLPPVPGTMR